MWNANRGESSDRSRRRFAAERLLVTPIRGRLQMKIAKTATRKCSAAMKMQPQIGANLEDNRL